MPIPFEMLQVTAAYSNAVLVAIMPHVSDFATKLDLPIPQPVTIAQVRHFGCSPRSDHIGGRVILTNDYSFTFNAGQVTLYHSPKSYYSLDDPNRIPEFYGPVKIKTDEAIKIARNTLKKLGYAESELHFDLPPKIKPPAKSAGHYVARYLIQWRDPNIPDTGKNGIPFATASVEVDATTGEIQMFYVSAHYASRPDPMIDVHPPVIGAPPKSQPVGGTKTYPVSQEYARAFLVAILPQLTDFVKKAGLDVKVPITTNDLEMSYYDCRLEEKKTVSVFLYLKNNDRFVYRHGQVIEFDAADANRWIAPNSLPEDKPPEKFYGPVNMSTSEALAVVRKAVDQLGWSAQVPRLKTPPEVVPPRKDGSNYFARYFLNWWPDDDGMQFAVAEVNATTRKIVSLGINDRASSQIWRDPPKIAVPMDVEISNETNPSPSAPSSIPALVPTLPPGLPLPNR